MGLDNGLGRRPPLGYNTWNDLGCTGVSEEGVKAAADALVRTGLRDRGYVYVNLDDCWHDWRRDPDTGRLRADPNRFPSGMRALADHLHQRGFLFGIYTDRGSSTCAGRPGSLGHEELDAVTFADWAVDYVKEDNCHSSTGPNDQATLFSQFGSMRDALNKTGRPMFFSVCGGGDQLPFANLSYYAADPRGGSNLANAWRVSSDCTDWLTCRYAYKIAGRLDNAAGPGGFNDPDMLIGSSAGSTRRLTRAQSRTQFSVWSILMAPLLLGGRMSELDGYDLETYGNPEVLAVSQDGLAKQGVLLATAGPRLVWARELSGGDWAFIFQNDALLGAGAVTCDAGCWGKLPVANGTTFVVRDLWQHALAETPEAVAGSPYTIAVDPYGASRMFRLFPLVAVLI